MDELGMIVSLLDEEPSAHGERDGRRRLVAATAAATAAGTDASRDRRRRASIRPRFALFGSRFALFGGFGLAGAAAAVAGAVLLSSGTTPRAPDPSGSAGSRLMLAAAESAERQPVRSHGRYWAVMEQRGGRLAEAGKEYDFVRQTGSYDAGPGKQAWYTSRMVSKRYLRPTGMKGARSAHLDSFAWSKTLLAPGSLFQTPVAATSRPGSAPPQVDLRTLPSGAAALRSALVRLIPEDWGNAKVNTTSWLFTNAKLILSGPVGPGTRGAVYRLLAQDPSLKSLGTVKDALGRTGTAFALRADADPTGRDFQGQIIIDTRTGRLLATQDVLLRPRGVWADRKAGDIVNYDAVLSYGWTDGVPDYPSPKTS
ncbi:hypothetical protein DZF91_20705 [Actinomadura logoneensis]|uniref:Uncharacterized protein n=1 Tax=Actinomadura logoneensis TaxID=2293572 RepID=A0A372JIJ7_9ACTN|nr:hypothetical protein [Actinomadura logoneensis]RFU39739.1 hypothetical protein DZF91_20705 [Actinomadura logoneensis]